MRDIIIILLNIGIDFQFKERKFINYYYIQIDLNAKKITPLNEIPHANEFEVFIKFEKDFVEKHDNIPLSVFNESQSGKLTSEI